MFFSLFFEVLLSRACDVGEISHEEGCVNICKSSYFNITTQMCENYIQCSDNKILNTTSNTCINSCENGFFINGTCTCYTGSQLSGNLCVVEYTVSGSFDPTFGLDWLYWGLIFITFINLFYIGICSCRYKKKLPQTLPVTLQL